MSTPKSWGIDVIDKSQHIDPSKEYLCNGHKVVNLTIKLFNSAGNEVTYPVKGTIIFKGPPLKTEYAIWSIDGRADVIFGKGHDLVLAN